MEKISEALKSINAKKQNLRKAYDSVKSHPSSLNSFTLQWSDVQQYFDSLQNSLEQRFKELQSKEQSPPSSLRSELKSYCLKMDGAGLRSFIMDHRKDLPTSCEDATFALGFAPDPAKLVLDALEGFYPLRSKRDRAGELGAIRRTCVLLLEGLTIINPEIKSSVKKSAKKLAVDWNHKVSTDSDDQLEALVFLQLLGTYGLAAEFDVDELLDLLVSIARRRQAVDLFKGLGFQDKISDFIQRLCSKGRQIDAVKFIYAFEVVDKFPVVPLLKDYFEESKKVPAEVRKRGTNPVQIQNESIAKETAYLRAIIKCIEDHKLEVEPEFSRESIDKRIRQLEKQKPEKRPPYFPHSATATVTTQSQPPQPKRPRLEDVALPIHPTGLLHDPSYLISSAHYNRPPYTMSTPAGPSGPSGVGAGEYMSPYLSSTAQYGLGVGATSSLGAGATSYPPYLSEPSGTASPNVGTNIYSSSELHLPTSLYDRSSGVGKHGLLSAYSSSSFYS
ncbi:hypothetical protein ACHQM5_025679 [Ranunculus cassubicifolius]